MPDAYTSNKLGLIEPAAGAYSGTWDDPLYANWQTIDAALGGTTTITLASSNVTLTIPTFPTNSNPPGVATSAQNLIIKLQGTLTANVTIFLPDKVTPGGPAMGGFWIIDDNTSGAFTVTIKTTAVGSTGVSTVQGKTIIVFVSDGINVKLADNGNSVNPELLVPTGTILPFGGTVGVPGYLYCDGLAYSRTTYANLFAAIGTTWGAGNGSTTFNVPNLTNMFLRGWGTSGVGVYEADDFKSHTHTPTVTDPGHNHTTAVLATTNSIGNGDVVTGVTGTGYQTIAGALTTTKTTGVTVANATIGGTETRPVNKRVFYIIKT